MKKTKKIILSVLSSVFTVTAFSAVAAGCSSSSEKIEGELPEYEYIYDAEFTDENDPDMKIDGVLDEDRWENKTWIEHTQTGVLTKYTATLTERGVYFAGIAYDTEVTYYGRFDMWQNTCFRVYIAREDAEKTKPSERLYFDVDIYDGRSYNQNRFTAAAVLEGEPNSHATASFTMEFFVSWDALDVDTEEYENGIPDKVKIAPVYYRVQKTDDDSVNAYDIRPTFCEPSVLKSYLWFNEDGYLNPNPESGDVGSSKYGYSKSDGWDLTKAADGEVSTTNGYSQALFFTDVHSEYFVAEATVTPSDVEDGDSNAHMGLILQNDKNWRGMGILTKTYLATDPHETVMRLLTPSVTDGTWPSDWTSTLYRGEATGDSFTVKIVKYGTKILYFINDELAYNEDNPDFAGEASVGLYSFGSYGTYSDYSARELTESEAYDYLMENDVYIVKDVPAVTGGKIVPDSQAVRKGEDLTFTVLPSAGYVLTGMKNGDKDIYEDVLANLEGNVYTMKNVSGAVEITATFARISTTRVPSVSGRIVSSQNEEQAVVSANIVVRDKQNPLVYYVFETSSKGYYTLANLPAKGTYEVGGRSLEISGVYEMTVTAEGYRPYVTEITQTGESQTHNITMPARILGGNVYTDEFSFQSNLTGWDMSREDEGVVSAHAGSSNNLLYFGGVSSEACAVVEFTVENKSLANTEIAPGVGLVLANKATKYQFVLIWDYFLIAPDMDWNQKTEVQNDAGYNLSTESNTGALRVKFIHDGTALAVYVRDADDEGAEEYEIYRGNFASLDKLTAYALFVTQGKDCDVEYRDVSVKTDEDAKDIVRSYLYGKVVVNEYDETQGKITLEGAEDGFVRFGEKLTVTSQSDKTAYVTVGGKTLVLADGESAEYTVESDVEIDVVFVGEEEMKRLSGSLAVNPDIPAFRMDYTAVTIEATDGVNTYVFDGVDSEGKYSLLLPAGTYTVTYKHPYLLSVITTRELASDIAAEQVVFKTLMPLSSASVSGVTVNGSTAEWTVGDGSVTSVENRLAKGESKFFPTTSGQFIVETTIDKLNTAGEETHPMAGIVMHTSTTGYAIMIQDNAEYSSLPVYAVRTTGEYKATVIGFCNYADGKVTLKGVAYGNALAVYANGKLLTVLKNTDEALEENFLGNVMAVGLRSVGNKTCFSDFGMITDLAKVEEGFGTATLSATVKPSDVGDVTFYDAIGGEALTEEKIAVGTDVKVVVTAAEGKFISSVLINGKTCSLTLDESGSRGEYVFRILENTAFSVTVAGRREVCGNVAVSAKLGVTCDITKTVILVTTAEGTTRIEDGVKADGSFAILVPSEEVTITLSCNGLLVKTYALEAGEERVEDLFCTFDRVAPQTDVALDGMTVGGTADKWTSGENVVTSSGNGREVKYFSQTGSAYTVTAKIENLLHGENGAWAWAGITFRAAGDDTQYAFMMFTTEKEGVDVYELTLVKVDTWEVISWYGVVDVTADSTMQVSSNGTQITLSFNGTEIATLSITDYASIVGWENAVGLITVDGSVTFRDVRVEIEG